MAVRKQIRDIYHFFFFSFLSVHLLCAVAMYSHLSEVVCDVLFVDVEGQPAWIPLRLKICHVSKLHEGMLPEFTTRGD